MTQIVGRRLGRYEVQQEIGRGGMARVYRALDTLLQREVAIKVLAPQLSLDPEFARRFEREAITAANLRHPSIVTVYDVGEQDGLHYIAMEFIRGRTLHSVLTERGALGLGYAISLLEPVARALDYAHSQGSVHRDVKPHNIMVDVEGRVLLTDFGIAQVAESESSERLTRTGIFMGTPEYLSPEQAEAQRVDGRSDLYSLGIVGYEIITGRVPFSGATPQLIVAHAQKQPPPPSSVVADLPSELDGVLARALAKQPQSRYPTGSALVEALRIVARRNTIALATTKQIAALAVPRVPPVGPSLPEPVRSVPPPGAATPVGPLPMLPRSALERGRSSPVADAAVAPPVPVPLQRSSLSPIAIIASIALVLALVLVLLFGSNVFGTDEVPPTSSPSRPTIALPPANQAGPLATSTATGTASPTAVVASATAETASSTAVPPSETPNEPSATAEPPSAEPTTPPPPPPPTRPPTRRPTVAPPPPTDTISVPTDTVVVPSDTPYPPPVTDTPTPPPSDTPEPPTEQVPTATDEPTRTGEPAQIPTAVVESPPPAQ